MDGESGGLSIRRRADLLGVHRSSYYSGPPAEESPENIAIMNFMDEEYLEHPESGVVTLVALMLAEGVVESLNPKRVRRLRQKMGLQTMYRRPRTTIPGSSSHIRKYLLRDLVISRPNQVWCTDITYIRMGRGFMYLTAIMDWHSRRILSWRLSNTMETEFCLSALRDAIKATGTTPEILNTDQGCQYTSDEWLNTVEEYGIKPSMDGKGCWVDNVVIERFWRTIKHDDIYLRDYANGREARYYIDRFITYYNGRKPHQSHGMKTPDFVYHEVAA